MKLFVPSVRRPSSGYTNDCDFRFCQHCGYSWKTVRVRQPGSADINLDEIDTRLNQLWNFDQATSYSKQKDSLQKELENFLLGLLGKPSLAIILPRDLCRFLVFKDRGGKTQVHRNGWVFLGQRGTHSCRCPVRLSYKTVDCYIGKLHAIFHAIGRDGEWDKRLSLRNLAGKSRLKTIFV